MLPRVFVSKTFLHVGGKILQGTAELSTGSSFKLCLHGENSGEHPPVGSVWVTQRKPGSPPAQLLSLGGGKTKDRRRKKQKREADQSLAAEEAAALTSIQTHQ